MEPSKFYYDISIEHDPEHIDERHPRKSKAEKTIFMESPLLENPGDYNLSVSKFSINTESLPVVIPEITTQQSRDDINDNRRLTLADDPIVFYFNYDYFVPGLDITVDNQISRSYDFTFQPEQLDAKKVKWINEERRWIDNTDEQCFLYTYNIFIEGLNQIMSLVTNYLKSIKYNDADEDEAPKPFDNLCGDDTNEGRIMSFKIINDRIAFQYHESLIWGSVRDDGNYNFNIKDFIIKFPKCLHKYIGQGFQTRTFNDGSWVYDYFFAKKSKGPDMFGENTYNVYFTQDYSTLVNWNPLKAIVIGSDTIPAVGEFLPVAHWDGWLNHEKTPEYEEYLRDNGIDYHNKDDDIFKKNTMCILDIYYPILTNPGDIRSTCIFSRDSINDGQSIELVPSSPITRFNIWIKWLDIYGNLHDLYLLPGRSCDIRFCFSKKPITSADLSEGINSIVEALAPPEAKKKKRERSNGKPDGIVLDGADNFGWVHL